jgi:hypothetical protein
MSEPRIRTSLQRLPSAGYRDPDHAKARELARNTYIATGGKTVCINAEWLTSWADKTQLDLLAEKALGVKRMGG